MKWLFLFISINASAQFGRGSEWHNQRMTYKTKVQYSRVWKVVGLTMIAGGIYAGQNKVPQRYDVPLIGFGAIITIEGIRLRKSAHK
jgi:hypothetical protein